MYSRLAGTASALLALAVMNPCAVTAQAPDARVERRSLSPTAGQDEISFDVPAGHLLEVRVLSDDFDTILELHSPDGGEPLRNDDDGNSTNSRLSTFAATGGRWRAVVTRYAEGSGDYDFRVSTVSPGEVQTIVGRFDADASVSPKGGRYQVHDFVVDAPVDLLVEIDAATAVQDLLAIAPDGHRHTSGYWGSGAGGSLTVTGAAPGRWQLVVFQDESDYGADEYRLHLIRAAPAGEAERFSGALEEGDEQLVRGEFFDRYYVEIGDEALVDIQVTSTEFDTFLAVRPPSGTWFQDDDGMQDGSRIELPGERGRWEVIVTSYASGATGAYRLAVIPR